MITHDKSPEAKRGRGRPRNDPVAEDPTPKPERPRMVIGKPCAWGPRPALQVRREETEEDYHAVSERILGLVRRDDAFRLERGLDQDQVRLRDAAVWLAAERKRYRTKTYDRYRTALLWRMERDGVEPEALAELRSASRQACRKTLDRDSNALKLKFISSDDLTRLQERLREHDDDSRVKLGYAGIKTSRLALDWLRGCILLGLRPSEWNDADIEIQNGAEVLIVRNRKYLETADGKPWRGNGRIRTLGLGWLPSELKERVRTLVDVLNAARRDDEYDRVYTLCRQSLWRANVELWPNRKRHITLYSGRHQFSASAKATGLSHETIAALMGHASTKTAGSSYGKTKYGHNVGGSIPDISPAAVATVRNRATTRKERAERGDTANSVVGAGMKG